MKRKAFEKERARESGGWWRKRKDLLSFTDDLVEIRERSS